jgi:hypothetical protein
VNYNFESQRCERRGTPPHVMVCILFSFNKLICERKKCESAVGVTQKNVQATFRRVHQLSGNGREDTGRKVDTTETDRETSGTGLTTTRIFGVPKRSQKTKKGYKIEARRTNEWKTRKE